MGLNLDKPERWKADAAASVDFYNDWFLRFAPQTYRNQRVIRTKEVQEAFGQTENLQRLSSDSLRKCPGILPILRMVTAPPIARDRLAGLAHVNRTLVETLEGKDGKTPRMPPRLAVETLQDALQRLTDVLRELLDMDLLPWVETTGKPTKEEVDRAAIVVADRLCGAAADPIIRNAQEKRQLDTLERWLKRRGYRHISTNEARDLGAMPAGTFTFRLTVPAGKKSASVNIPIDCVVKPHAAPPQSMPVLIEAKSAGDATNTNKRRKEEAQKYTQLKARYGKDVSFILLLCGYFETSYLGDEAAEGIDWVREHRLNDLVALVGGTPPRQAGDVREMQRGYAATADEMLEAERFALQQAVDDSKSGDERNRMGQFSTPYDLARRMVAGTIVHLPLNTEVSFLEPALGTGVFFSALRSEKNDRTLTTAVGVEIDPSYAEIAKRLWNPLGLTVETGDFVRFAQDPANRGRFNLLCTNPPYVRHHHLDAVDKVAMQELVFRSTGLAVSGLAGLYVYFVLLADALLAEEGVATWLLPAEFLYVNYGKPLRDYLTRCVTLLGIHHFDPEDVQFDDALVSSCIITYRKHRPSQSVTVPFTSGAALDQPKQRRTVDTDTLRTMPKWTISHWDAAASLPSEDVVRLGQLFDVRRGIATGDNSFFILSSAIATEFCIPPQFLRPILPSPRYLKTDVIEATAEGVPVLPEVRYLLDCNLPPDRVQHEYPGLWAYLETGRERGVHEGYLCAGRDFWYRQERRDPSPFLVTYMGRAVEGRANPIRFILNLSRAVATNVYLYLYPFPQLGLTQHPDVARLREIFDALRAIPLLDMLRAGRTYGGGLHKVEPKELTSITLPDFPAWATTSVSRQPMLV